MKSADATVFVAERVNRPCCPECGDIGDDDYCGPEFYICHNDDCDIGSFEVLDRDELENLVEYLRYRNEPDEIRLYE